MGGLFSYRQTSYVHAQTLAVLIVAALTAISLAAPPSLAYDPAFGLTRWYGLLQGAPFDATLDPDPADIARDIVNAASWWSPGQYLVSGALTLTGMRLGTATVLIAGLCNLAALLGWIRLAQAFTLGPRLAVVATALIATFHYATSAYGIYSGGEILLQAATPWLLLAAWHVPHAPALPAAALAFAAVSIGFIAKLNGLIVMAAALPAASVLVLYRVRRVTPGMMGGALGALAAVALVYVFWFATKPVTHFAGGGEAFGVVRLLLALSAPWTSPLAFQDLMAWLLQNPGRAVIHSDAPVVLLGLTPLAIALAAIFLFDRQASDGERRLRMFGLLMLAGFTFWMLLLYARDAPLPLHERHYRPVGMLLLLCLMATAMRPGTHRVIRTGLLGLFGAMAAYGLASFGARAMSAQRQTVDAYSWTIQRNADAQSLAELRRAFATEGRDALFYLGAPELAATLPYNARMIPEAPDMMSEAALAAARRHGRVKGHVTVLVNNALPAAKVDAILRAFADYDPGGWSKTTYEKATIYKSGGAR